MSMIVNHNLAALEGLKILDRNTLKMERTMQKLASGLKTDITALDNTSGLAISEVMRSRIDGMYKGISNAQDGISLIQTATGGLEQIQSILGRMRELAVQAANDTLTQQDRSYIQTEIDELKDEIDRVGNTTQFNKKKLLNGDQAVLWSSSNNKVRAVIKGGLREIDQFGQSKVVEANYKIKITADPGKAEIQKSDIFKIKHENVMTNKVINPAAGVEDVSINGIPAGSWTVSSRGTETTPATGTDSAVTGIYGVDMAISISGITGANSRDGASSSFGEMNYIITQNDIDDMNASGQGGDVVEITDGANVLAVHKIRVGETQRDIQEDIISQLNGEKAQAIAGQSGYKLDAYWTTEGDADAAEGEMGYSGVFRAIIYRTDGETAKSLQIVGVDAALTGAGFGAGTNETLEGATPYSTAISQADSEGNGSMILTFADGLANLDGNASILFEVTDVNTRAGTVTFNATANILTTDGINKIAKQENIVVGLETTEITLTGSNSPSENPAVGVFNLSMADGNAAKLYNKGDKIVYNLVADNSTVNSGDTESTTDNTIIIDGALNPNWDDSWGGSATRNQMKFAVESSKLSGKEVHFKNFYLNEKTGEAFEGDIAVTFEKANISQNDLFGGGTNLATFESSYIGQTANGDVKLRDIDKFWDSQGRFMLEDPQTITVVQGDGTKADVTLYAYDTLEEVAAKLNNAISIGLGQGQYVDDASHFVEFIGASSVKSLAGDTNDSVAGTFVLRSVIPGYAGSISFSSPSEEILNAFSLNTIQESTESKYNVSIYDAHTENEVAKDIKVTGNRLIGVIKNVDIEFDSMSGISASWWDENRKAYIYNKSEETTAVLHLSDNTLVLQVGADQGEDLAINIGDMRTNAIGVDKVNVMTRESASHAISLIDSAADKVLTQLAKLGGSQSRLEYHINNMTSEAQALTSANSRIRDTDMAREYMEYTKMQILMQTTSAMLAQANQQQQNIAGLFR